MTRRHRARLEDVANRAEVSVSIASRILNGRPVSVRPETATRVRTAANELGYRASGPARALRARATGIIGVLVPDLTNPAIARIVRGAHETAADRGLATLISEHSEDEATENQLLDLCRNGRIDGLLVLSARGGTRTVVVLSDERIPHVFVNRPVSGSGRNVVLEPEGPARAVADYLSTLGHIRIGHVGGPQDVEVARLRASSFVKAMATHREATVEIEPAEFTAMDGARATVKLLGRAPRPTSIYAASTSQAFGVLNAAWSSEIEVPSELSVVAFDDLPLAASTIPPLTTVKVDLEALGRVAVDAVVEQIAGAEPRDILVDSDARVVVRQSTAHALGAEAT